MQSNFKAFFVVFFGLFLVANSYAQDASFKWSDIKNNTNVGLQNPTFVFPEDSGFTVYSIEASGTQYYAPKEIHVTKFNDLGEIDSTINFMLPKRLQKDATLLKVIEGNNKLYFFSFIAVKKDKKNVLYTQVYDNATATISEAKELYTLPIEKVNNSGFFEVVLSQDKNIFSVLVNKPFVKKTKEAIEVLTLDTNLKILSQSEHTLSFDSKRANREALFVENNGTVSIVKKTNIFKKEPITSLITIKEGNVNEQQVSAEGFYVSDNRVITINGQQYLLGFATDNAKPAVSMGGAKDKSFFIYNISEQKIIENEGWKPEILKKILGKGFLHLTIKDILINNNDIYLIGDCFSEKSETIEGKNFEYNYSYNFGPGVVVKLNTEGKVAYQSFIKYGEGYKNKAKALGSFYPYLDNGELKILANEKESVLKKKMIVSGRAAAARTMVLKTFDATGNITETPFWNSGIGGKNDLVYFGPTKTIPLNNKIFYIYAMGGEYQRFGKIILE